MHISIPMGMLLRSHNKIREGLTKRAVTRLDQLPYKNEFLDELILELVNRKK